MVVGGWGGGCVWGVVFVCVFGFGWVCLACCVGGGIGSEGRVRGGGVGGGGGGGVGGGGAVGETKTGVERTGEPDLGTRKVQERSGHGIG